jgi:hypothetical protein
MDKQSNSEFKIMLCIPHYGNSNRTYLLNCLREYDRYQKYKIDCYLDVTDPIELPEYNNIKIFVSYHDKSVGMELTLKHREIMVSKLNDYDIFLYAEDDILINENNIDSWLSIQKNLPSNFVCGFLRYEQKENNPYKFLFDTHPTHSIHRHGKETIEIFKNGFLIDGEKYVEPYNIHQGCYILTRDMLNSVINSGKYLENENHYVGVLEGAASNVFYKCGFVRVLPTKGIQKLLVHHSCNKYIKKLPYFYTENTTLNDVKWEAFLN